MHFSHPVRLIACAALAGSAAFAAVAPGGVASAAVKKVSCASESGSATVGTLSGCTGTGAALTGPTGSLDIASNTITWSTSATSITTVTNTILSGKKDKCTPPAGDTNAVEVKLKGTVTGGTVLVGSKVGGTLCAFSDPSGDVIVNNFPGKAFSV